MQRILLLALSASAASMTAGFLHAPSTPSVGHQPQQLSSLATLKRKGNEHKVSTFAVGACGLRRGSLASVRKTQSRTNPQMAISVLGALTAPVVAIAALGTLDGFGKMILNLPRILEYQMRYASRLMEQGSGTTGIDLDPLDLFRRRLDESKEYRYNALKLFVKYDANGDGKISEEELRECLSTEPLFQGDGLPVDFGNKLLSSLSLSSDIGPQEFLTLVRGKSTSAENSDKMLTAARLDVVESAYQECRDLTSEYAKTFFLATLAMEPQQAKATWAIYAWCRRVDEIVDGPNVDPNPEVLRAKLSEWDERLDRMYQGVEGTRGLDMFDIAFRDMIRQFPGSDIEPYRDMVKGMVMDIDQDTYETWDDLYLYCYRVASTVGLMTLPVMGTAPGVTLQEARDPAVALGIALQITNILRDVGEDARDRGRIYLPQADLRTFGITPESILERARNGGKPDEAYITMMKYQIERARAYYAQAEAGIALLAPGAQLPVAVAAELYKGILDKIEQNGYDNFNTRAYLTREEKMLAVPPLWFKTATGGWEEARRKAETELAAK